MALQDEDGYTPLIRSAVCNNIEVIDLLIAYGAEIDGTNKNSQTALFGAANKGHAGCVESLLKAGAFVDYRHYIRAF